jgi:hypothetical protein
VPTTVIVPPVVLVVLEPITAVLLATHAMSLVPLFQLAFVEFQVPLPSVTPVAKLPSESQVSGAA